MTTNTQEYLADAVKMIIGPAPESLEDPSVIKVYQKAVDLYGLVHARFIT